MRTLAERVLGSSTREMSATLPLNTRSGKAFSRISAESPRWTSPRSFSNTSQTTQTCDRSAMVNKIGSVVEALDAFESGNVLLDDRAGDGRAQVEQRRRMRGIAANDPDFLLGRGDHFGFVLGVLRELQDLSRRSRRGQYSIWARSRALRESSSSARAF